MLRRPFMLPGVLSIRRVCLLVGAAVIAAVTVPALAAAPTAAPGAGFASFGVEFDPYGGWTYDFFKFKGTVPVGGSLQSASLKSAGCTAAGGGFDPCEAWLTGTVAGGRVHGSCLVVPQSTLDPKVDPVAVGPAVQKMTLRCHLTTSDGALALGLHATGVSIGDPTATGPNGPGPAPSAGRGFEGVYTARG